MAATDNAEGIGPWDGPALATFCEWDPVFVAPMVAPSAAPPVGGGQPRPLTPTAAVVRSLNITAPTAGTVILNASGYFAFPDTSTLDAARCSITTGTAVDFSHLIVFGENTANGMSHVPFGATRGFSVAAGTHTINLSARRPSVTRPSAAWK